MPDGGMAIGTFDLTVGDMLLVHGLRAMFHAQDFGLFVTLKALSFRNMAVSYNHTHMAPLTGHPSCNILAVIKVPAFDSNVPFGFDVARAAFSHSTRNAFLFPFGSSLIKVTDKAVGLVNSKVFPLNELSMTACASQSHPPF
jgi:hypothetical protein